MEYPFQKEDDLVIEVPTRWQVGSLPEAKTQNGGNVLTYTTKAVSENGKLHLTRTLDVSFR